MKISVLVTTHNAEAYVIDTIKSVMTQTYQDFELIIVDDGSTDNTVKIITDYLLETSSKKIKLQTTSHIGRSAALNFAIKLAAHDWIAIVDADDLWNVHKLALQVHYIERFNLDFLATRSRIFYHNEEVNIFEENYQRKVTGNPLIEITFNKMLYRNLIPHSSILVRKVFLNYAANRNSQVDYEMWLRLLNKNTKIYLLDHCLIYHRIHPNQSFEAKKRFRYALSATLLQLKYCVLRGKLLPTFFVVLKFCYYILLPRKIRFLIREFIT